MTQGHSRRNAVRAALATLLMVGAAWLAPAGQAVAAPGQLGYDGCLASMPGQGCGDLPAGLITGANTLAVSPDGRSVYVASSPPDVIAHFVAPGADGQIAYDDCMASRPFQTCLDLPLAPLDGAYGVAVSPDGGSVYVASASGSLAHFFVSGPDGKLAYDRCHADTAAQGCIDLLGTPLGGASEVAVGPDGSSVYVAGTLSQRLAHFLRNDPQGGLAYDGCLEGQPFCLPTPPTPLNRPHRVAVSPDGRSVYVAVTDSAAIAHFIAAGPHGQLVYAGCLADDAAQGCVDLPGTPLTGAWGVAVSPDGRSVYVAAAGSDSLARFVANAPEGRLTYAGCLANTAAPNCTDLPGAPLDEARSVAVSPDGRSVYVASSASGSIAHFFRDPEGQIAYDGCLANDDVDGCANLPGAPIAGAYGVAVSPNNRSVYVVSADSGSLAHFVRALGDAPPPGSVTTPGTQPGALTTPGAARRPERIGFGSKTLVTLKLAAKRVPARGPLPIVVTNANGFAVTGRLSAATAKAAATKSEQGRIKLKPRTFRVAAKRKTTVKLRLPTTLGRLLRREGKLTLVLRAKLRDPVGGTRAVTKRLSPRLRHGRTRTAAGMAGPGTVS
jgi:DNA-binding beta-propeller fold protein YncE